MSEITAKVILRSRYDTNHKGSPDLITMVVEYPRIIHAEMLTHRVLSRNSASSRAIPFDKMVEQLTGVPARFGKNNKGMQDTGEDFQAWVPLKEILGQDYEIAPEDAWDLSKDYALAFARAFKIAGYHKQIYNRLTEPYQTIKVIITATEWDNFFWLRLDEAADPTIQALAKTMYAAYKQSEYEVQMLYYNDWHLPFVDCRRSDAGGGLVYTITGETLSLEEAIKVSAARCAAISFRNTDYPLEKCLQVYKTLAGGDKIHASALEHQATPVPLESLKAYRHPVHWPEGISHMDKDGNYWSGNFKSWIQHRKLVKNENYIKQ